VSRSDKKRPIALLLAIGLAAAFAYATLPSPSSNEGTAQKAEPTARTRFIVGPMARGQGDYRRFSDIWGILLHSTQGVPSGDLRLLSRSPKLSAHFLVLPNGTIRQLVPIARVAFHAGRGELDGHSGNLNAGLVGIEVSNPSKRGRNVPYPEVQLQAVDRVIKIIDDRLGRQVPIFGHKEMIRYPGGWRKTDPEGDFPLAAYKRYRRHAGP
jgi:N-acetylmuramoyl-L-alanine amidase